MSRRHVPENNTGRYIEREHESIRFDDEDRRGFHADATLKGEAMGLGPEELIEFAIARMEKRNKLIERLLRYVPRKYEERIKALAAPHDEAVQALRAVNVLIANGRHALAALEKP